MNDLQEPEAIARTALVAVPRAAAVAVIEAEAILAAASRAGTVSIPEVALVDSKACQEGRPGAGHQAVQVGGCHAFSHGKTPAYPRAVQIPYSQDPVLPG